jgi:hypothetical protein
MSYATFLCILHNTERERERERDKSKITSLDITPNRPGDATKQRETSHCNFTDLILPCFMIFYFCSFSSHPEALHLSPYIVHVPSNHFVTLQALFPVDFQLCVLANSQTFYTAPIVTRLQFWQSFVFFIDLFPLSFLAFDCVFVGVSFSGCCSFPSSALMPVFVWALSSCQA